MLLWYENMIVVCVYVLIDLCRGDDKGDESKIMKKKVLLSGGDGGKNNCFILS